MLQLQLPVDEVLGADGDAADGRAQSLAQAQAGAVAPGQQVVHARTRLHGGVEEAGAVAVQQEPVGAADLRNLECRMMFS